MATGNDEAFGKYLEQLDSDLKSGKGEATLELLKSLQNWCKDAKINAKNRKFIKTIYTRERDKFLLSG